MRGMLVRTFTFPPPLPCHWSCRVARLSPTSLLLALVLPRGGA